MPYSFLQVRHGAEKGSGRPLAIKPLRWRYAADNNWQRPEPKVNRHD